MKEITVTVDSVTVALKVPRAVELEFRGDLTEAGVEPRSTAPISDVARALPVSVEPAPAARAGLPIADTAFIDQQQSRISELYAQVDKKERSIRGYKGVVARTKRRVSKGVCPCCSQKFKNLKEHMTSEHPDWNPDREAEARAAKS